MAHITIDYTPAVNQTAGIGRLTREVVGALLDQPRAHRFSLFVMGRATPRDAPAPVRAHPLTDRWFHRLWFRAGLRAPVEWFAGRCDLYHATDFVLPPTRRATRTVLTVHDLSFERDPESAVPTLLRFLRRVVPDSARRANHIVADSHATARDLAELYGIPPDKITTIHSGVDARFFAAAGAGLREQEAAVRAKYGIGDAPFVLTVGTLQKRKNHLTLVRAFARLASAAPPGRDLRLVIAGGKGWLYDEVLREVERLGIAGRTAFIGFVSDADLPALYRAASAFAFPSVYEGFGLPVLEAMAAGTPVVASNASSLPEIAGDTGVLHDPFDVDGLAEGLRRALWDEAHRADVIPRAIARARAFTWRAAAQRLLGVYESVLSAAAPPGSTIAA